MTARFNQDTSGNAATATTVSGIVTAAHGGTGLATLPQYGVMVGAGTGTVVSVQNTTGTNEFLQQVNGSGQNPTFGTIAAADVAAAGTLSNNTTGIASTARSVSTLKVNQTQTPSNTSPVTANGFGGTITMAAALTGTETDTFTFNNSNIVTTSQIFLQVVGLTIAAGIIPMVTHGVPGTGSVTISVYNPGAGTLTAPLGIDYLINA